VKENQHYPDTYSERGESVTRRRLEDDIRWQLAVIDFMYIDEDPGDVLPS